MISLLALSLFAVSSHGYARREFMRALAVQSCAMEPDWTSCRSMAALGCCVEGKCYFDNETNEDCAAVQQGRMIEERYAARKYWMAERDLAVMSCVAQPDWTSCRQMQAVGCCVDEICLFDNETNAQCVSVQGGRMMEERAARQLEERLARQFF